MFGSFVTLLPLVPLPAPVPGVSVFVAVPALVPGGSVLVAIPVLVLAVSVLVAVPVPVPAAPSAAKAAHSLPSPPPPPQALSKKDSTSIGMKEYAARMAKPEQRETPKLGLPAPLPGRFRTEVRATRARFWRSLNGLLSLRQKKRDLRIGR